MPHSFSTSREPAAPPSASRLPAAELADAPAHPLVWMPRGPQPAHKGRGSSWTLAHRFSRDEREAVDDGWGSLDQAAEAASAPPATRVVAEQVKSILTGNDSPDIHFDLSINPYRGCEHGCIFIAV